MRAAFAIFRAFPGTSRRIPIVLPHISSSRISDGADFRLQLSGEHELFLRREAGFVLLEFFGDFSCFFIVVDVVRARHSVQESLIEFLAQEVRRVAVRVVGVADAFGVSGDESALAVESDVSDDEQAACAHLAGEFHGIVEE